MLRIALLLAAAIAVAGCQQQQLQQQEQRANRKVIGKDAAIEIARRHVAEAYPGLAIDPQPTSAEFVLDQQVMNGQIWAIYFSCSGKRGPDGKASGPPPFRAVSVWVLPDGKVRGVVTHAP